MKKNVFLMVILGMVLAFGLVLVGCDDSGSGNGGGDNTDPKTLVITNTNHTRFTGLNSSGVAVYPAGTSFSDVLASTALVAGALSTNSDFSYTSSTSTFPLYLPSGGTRWTGHGNYDVYFAGYASYDTTGSPIKLYKQANVAFNSASVTINGATVTDVTPGGVGDTVPAALQGTWRAKTGSHANDPAYDIVFTANTITWSGAGPYPLQTVTGTHIIFVGGTSHEYTLNGSIFRIKDGGGSWQEREKV